MSQNTSRPHSSHGKPHSASLPLDNTVLGFLQLHHFGTPKTCERKYLGRKMFHKISVTERFVKAPNFSRSSAKFAGQCNGSVFFLLLFETRFMFRCVIFSTWILRLGKHHLPKHPEHGEIKKAEWKCRDFSPNEWTPWTKWNTVNQKCYRQ